ncbi:hypothetical protein RHGRI_029920 [Rhododendron griersonianum]|uniref:PB1-like domain-containing protein n=1 Tax=Rhododendron griersonianum TaxID=479676 RepID=A0AAV6IPI7_9ERIC|nr:hypothetical protein RHGRI_029920 [Rhododendron griersonianum]
MDHFMRFAFHLVLILALADCLVYLDFHACSFGPPYDLGVEKGFYLWIEDPPLLVVLEHQLLHFWQIHEKGDVHFSIKLHYDGKLVVGVNSRRYVGGKVCFFDWVDSDYMGMIELKDMVRELNLFGSMTYPYKVPTRDLYHGFRNLDDDSDCVEMVRWIKLSKTIEVYVEHHEIFSNENHHLTTGVAVEEHLTTGVADEEQDGNGDRDVYEGDEDEDYTNSSDDKTDLEDFVDSEANDDEDDRLFDIHVDRNVEWGELSMGKGKEPMTTSSTQANDNEESDIEAQSDELVSLNGSDVVEAENKASWNWFLEILSEDLNIYNNPNFTFISNKQKVRKKQTTANGQQQNASQLTMGTSGSQPTMGTSFSQPQAAMGTKRPFNMRAPQATQGVNIRAPPQATHGVNTRANQRKFINYSGLPKASTKRA